MMGRYIWGACSWNEFYMLYYFAGFNGYLLLGHYLRSHTVSLGRTLAWGIPVCIQIPAAAAAAFAVSWLLVLGIRKLAGKNAGYIVG